MLSLSGPSVNQALDSRSKQLFWIAWQFLIDISQFELDVVLPFLKFEKNIGKTVTGSRPKKF